MSNDATKDSILIVATKLFSRFGFYKTSMDEIAKMSRKAKGSLYYHFSSKEDLFKEVVSIELTTLKNQLAIIVSNPDLNASEKIKQYFIKRMKVLNYAANYHETLKADFYEHFNFIDDIRTEFDEWEKESLKKIILQGTDNKEFSNLGNIIVIIDVFVMVLKGLEIPFFLQNKYENYAPHFDGLIGILTKGMAK
ncbi:MAG: TetR/AcrR family transcriptional regulator [Paludibacter sp.]|nr:TetR/AcrR family transcriptional regulator [Paludibacter sp.]